MGFLELLLLLWPQRLRFVVLSIVVGSTAFFLGKLLYVLFMAPTGIDVQDQMSETFFWIPVIYLLSFMIPGMRGGRFTATLFSTLFLGISMVYVGVDLKLANRWGVIYSLVEMNLANTVLLALTYAFIGYTAGFTMIESAVHNGIPKKGSTGSNRTPRWSPWGDSGGLVKEYATRCKERYTQVRTKMEAAERYAHTDLLTGLPNRRVLELEFDQMLARSRASNRQVAALFIDIDRFKVVNDTLGHEAGDQLLRQVADRLRHATREGDLLVRLSGDEFVLIGMGIDGQ